MRELQPRGLFVGLATLDVIHRIDAPPAPNEKITATAQFVAAGGPAANAAVTFAALGGRPTLVTALGTGTIARAIADDLRLAGVDVVDIAETRENISSVSSVSVLERTGERAVIGGDAAGLIIEAPSAQLLDALLLGIDVVLFDGHYPHLAQAIASRMHRFEIPSILDAGRWKPVMADLISHVSDVVASADFRVPGTLTSSETAQRLSESGAPVVVSTAGERPVRWWSGGGHGEVPVRTVAAVDTLAAGDVFHGAYAFARVNVLDIRERIAYANEVAATRCEYVGPRSWIGAIGLIPLPAATDPPETQVQTPELPTARGEK